MRLTSFICRALTELDIRDNGNLFELDLSNLHTLQVHILSIQFLLDNAIIKKIQSFNVIFSLYCNSLLKQSHRMLSFYRSIKRSILFH